MKFLATPLIAAFLFVAAPDSKPTAPDYKATVVDEVTQMIESSSAHTRTTLKASLREVSREGSLEFWSSGGLLQKVEQSDGSTSYDVFALYPKHIEVIALSADAAVAHFS